MNKPTRTIRSRTREAILDAASSAFRELGFEQSSMDEIAARAGVARGTLYYNFVSKDDIAIGIAERYRAMGYATLLEQQSAGADIRTLLNDFFAFAGTWIALNRDAAFIGTTAAMKGIGRAPDRPGTTSVLEKLVAQGQDEDLFRRDVPAPAIARFLAALLTQAALLGPDVDGGDETDWPTQLLNMALEGVQAREDSQ